MIDADAPRPSPWPWLVACTLSAAWIDFGNIHRLHHADSLLNVLVSLYHWTPFFWEQDRYGMLIPLLATPIAHPLANLLAQDFCTIFSGASVFFLVARHALRDASYVWAGALGASGFFALAPARYQFEYLVDTSYALGLALGLAGLIFVERSGRMRWVSGGVLMVLANWVNCMSAAYLAPLVVFRGVSDVGGVFERHAEGGLKTWARGALGRAWKTEVVRGVVLLAIGHVAGGQLMTLSKYRQTNLQALPVGEWAGAMGKLSARTWDDLIPPYWPALLCAEAALGLLVLITPALKNRRGVARGAAVLVASALTLMLLTATREWVARNNYPSRYLIPSVIYFQAACATLAVSAVCRVRGLQRFSAPVLLSFLMLAASAWGYGVPSLRRVRADVDRVFGARTADILDARCTHVSGDYWRVWPAVFHANLVLYERKAGHVIWGVTFRGSPAYSHWKTMPMESIRVAVPDGDGFAEGWIASYPLSFGKMVVLERKGAVRVWGLRSEKGEVNVDQGRNGKENRPD